jgi:hypothetical protein
MSNVRMTPNRSKTYLLPILSEYISFDTVTSSFINCYTFDLENIHRNCIFLLYNANIKDPAFTKFEHSLSKIPGYVKHYDLKDNQVLYVIKFPTEYLAEYEHYCNGNYSLYAHDAKDLILRYWKPKLSTESMTKMKHVFDKNDILRKQMEKDLGVTIKPGSELGTIADPMDETFDIKANIINYI